MFIVNNGTITNDKTLNIGSYTKYDVVFKFDGQQFDYEDKFILTIANEKSNLYGFLDETGCIRFTLFPFDWIQDAETSASISVEKNGVEILSDTISIEAERESGGGDSGMIINDVATLSGIAPKENNVYLKTLAANDAVSFSVSGSKPINFELWLNMGSVVSFTFDNSILWMDGNTVKSTNLPPLFNEANTLYVIACRYDGTNVIANLAYKKQ